MTNTSAAVNISMLFFFRPRIKIINNNANNNTSLKTLPRVPCRVAAGLSATSSQTGLAAKPNSSPSRKYKGALGTYPT